MKRVPRELYCLSAGTSLEQFRPIDVCFKVVGTGSVGTRDYCIYMEGNGAGDPLFLQIKEEVGSAYLPYCGGSTARSRRTGAA